MPNRCLTTGDEIIDETLGGGIRAGCITEIYGVASSGKTQLAMQLALTAQLTEKDGGFDSASLLILTDKPLPIKRLYELSKNNSRLDRIHVLHVGNLETQHHMIMYQLEQQMKRNYIRLVVIDSVAGNMRQDAEFHLESHERNRFVAEMMNQLKRLAVKMDAVVVLVNQVAQRMSKRTIVANSLVRHAQGLESSDGLQEALGMYCDTCPAMAEVLSPYINASIMLARNGDSRTISLRYSPMSPSRSCCFIISSDKGIVGI